MRDEDRVLDLGGPRPKSLFAILALSVGEVVPADRIVDELWGEFAPRSARHLLHVYVSSLRKQVGARLGTRAGGYVLDLDPADVDSRRFELLFTQGRAKLREGDVQGASDLIGDALGLWRGPALADFRDEGFAQTEIARLEELRLAALEDRIDADIALGRHAELVGEIGALIARHPLRERLRSQIMLALYGAGRQAEALAAYHDARRILVEELGLEPSEELREVQRRILRRDASLRRMPHVALPVPKSTPVASRRRPLRVVLAVAMALTAAAVVAVLGFARGGSSVLRQDAVASIAAADAKVMDYTQVGTTPRNVAFGEGAVWVLNADDQTISRIDPETRQVVKTIGTGGTPTELEVGEGAVWVGTRGDLRGAPSGGSTTAVSRIDPATGAVVGRLILPRARSNTLLSNAVLGVSQLTVGAGAVWAINPDLTVSRIDPRTGELVTTVTDTKVSASSGIAAGPEGVWVIGEGASVTRIDTRTNRTGQTITLGATPFLVDIAVGAGSVWTTVPEDGVVWRIDPGREPHTRTISVGFGVTNIVYADGALWATNFIDGTVSRIDTRTNTVTRQIPISGTPQGIAAGAGAVWVSVAGAIGHDRLPVAACGPLESGGQTPDVVIASDLPLQGRAAAVTRPMVEAIRFVLRGRDFEAGNYVVGYQSCDDSTARSGSFDFFKCGSNARSYARAEQLVAVIGPYDSDCAQVELIVANGVSRGQLAMVSPATTYSGLTRGGSGAWASRTDPKRYYPAGRRTFFRLPAPDDLQAAASALLAKQLGIRRVYVLDGGGPWGLAVRRSFVAAALTLGLQIAGSEAWDPRGRRYAPLVERVARSRADGVFLGGSLLANGGRVVKVLRARVGGDVVFIAGEGFARIPDVLRAAGPAAVGTYVIAPGIPLQELSPAGKRFARAFGATQPDAALRAGVTEAAQAASLLLDAIARSDSTRLSVLRELRALEVKEGILGSFSFDRNGDVAPTRVAVYRITGTVPTARDGVVFSEFRGATVDRVLTVPRALLDG